MSCNHYSRRHGFSLIDTMVVVAIVAVLIGLIVPVIFFARGAAERSACQNNLHQLAVAVHEHHDQLGRMPPYMSREFGADWFDFLLPYLGELQWRRSAAHGSLVGAKTSYAVLICPSDPSRTLEPYLSKTNYLANWYALTNTPQGCVAPAQSFASLTNGLSNVVLFGEGYSVCKTIPRPDLESPFYHNFGITPFDELPSDDPKYLPKDFTMFQVRPSVLDCDFWRTQTPHGSMQVALADGSVRSVDPGIDPLNWKKALKPRTGEVPEDW